MWILSMDLLRVTLLVIEIDLVRNSELMSNLM
jgi:hypothetical protein